MVLPLFNAASILTDRVHTEVLPDDKSRPEAVYTPGWKDEEQRAAYEAYRNWKPRAEASAYENIIHEVSDVKVGDLVLVVENSRYKGEWRYNPVSDKDTIAVVAYQRIHRFHVVTAVTAKRVTLASVRIPNANWSPDMEYVVNDWTETYAPYAEARRIIKTGLTLEEFKARVRQHPDYARFVANFEAGLKKRQEMEAKEAAEREAAREAAEPIKAAAKQASEALACTGNVVGTAGYPAKRVTISLRYVDHSEVRRLLVLALRGRLALGEITKEEHDAAVATLVSAVQG